MIGLLLRGRWVLPVPATGDVQPLGSTNGELSYYAGRPLPGAALTDADPAIGNMFSMGPWPQARRQVCSAYARLVERHDTAPGSDTAARVIEAAAFCTDDNGRGPVVRQHLNMHTGEYATKRE